MFFFFFGWNPLLTWTIDGVCGWDIWTLFNCCPRSNALCCGISIRTGAVLIVDCFWRIFCMELIGWNADNCCSGVFKRELLLFAFFIEEVEEKKAEIDRVGPAGAITAVGRVETPTGGIAVNKAGGVDCSIASFGCWDSLK